MQLKTVVDGPLAADGLDCTEGRSLKITISTRRFCALPTTEVLSESGLVSANAVADSRVCGIPYCPDRYRSIETLRAADNSQLSRKREL
jgi:hypothetical protein